ncbi:hypothetical protein TREMEDRAFT_66426 [Tremella mesenterica DSM 1558]|uniref:uncharacterized protein n=1 Tax=Tremella mesenterica (strain ATCC 24925 / CBS 8224 / DSM 1558 / NBRC 9311 / NRRL Y-6157 / RJB 2259-6 / UBC 559-6) TaxID=578456 RepID=UPI00032C18B3|nr:uncharacterized protein TREMEDRAFT_66426 [Tremella mesenterica DSM 1558]EIW65596.1 hypothetical protein TREMEDRAFT_66426 [Tremella mesenterica DSM 1558]
MRQEEAAKSWSCTVLGVVNISGGKDASWNLEEWVGKGQVALTEQSWNGVFVISSSLYYLASKPLLLDPLCIILYSSPRDDRLSNPFKSEGTLAETITSQDKQPITPPLRFLTDQTRVNQGPIMLVNSTRSRRQWSLLRDCEIGATRRISNVTQSELEKMRIEFKLAIEDQQVTKIKLEARTNELVKIEQQTGKFWH